MAAYLVAKSKQDTQDLRPFLKEKLPDYMIPATFTWLESFPLNSNGKVDRQVLPKPQENQSIPSQHIPQTTIEQTLATLWQAALHREHVGVDDNFFDLGGNSLLLVQIHHQLIKILNREIPIMTLFRYPTIYDLARYLEGCAPGVSATSYDERVQKQKQVRQQRQMKIPHSDA